MTLLALDLGTTTGWSIGTIPFTSGFISFKPQRFEGGGMRYLRFRRWLDEMHASANISEVVFEEVRNHIGVDAAHAYGGFLATLTSWCESKNVPYSAKTVQAIKTFATGKGNSKKPLVVAAVRKKYGAHIKDDNEADAVALLHLKLSEIDDIFG